MTDIAVYMITHDRPDETTAAIKLLRNRAGCDFDLYVVDSGSGPVLQNRLAGMETEGLIDNLVMADQNIGQNLAANIALDEIQKGDYRWIVCWSPDVYPKTRRCLKKLVRASEAFFSAGVSVILSPKVSGGITPESFTATGDDIGFPYHEVDYLKGYVRVHPAGFFREFRFNKFGALGSGECLDVKDQSVEQNMPHIVVENIKVRHVGDDEPGLIARYVGYGL